MRDSLASQIVAGLSDLESWSFLHTFVASLM
jgi:hypothetical protein